MEGQVMSTAEVRESKNFYTPEDLLAMANGDDYELVDGQLVEKNMGTKSSWVSTQVGHRIQSFIDLHPVGWLLTEASYQCFPDAPAKVRRPDVSFIHFGRLEDEELPDGHCPIAPDLVVEVTSPRDTHYEVAEKIEEYLSAGVSLVWIVNPHTRTVLVYRKDLDTVSFLHEADELSGEDVLPGFRCPVRDVFPPVKSGGEKE
jgi:Uma2 family endonuclease